MRLTAFVADRDPVAGLMRSTSTVSLTTLPSMTACTTVRVSTGSVVVPYGFVGSITSSEFMDCGANGRADERAQADGRDGPGEGVHRRVRPTRQDRGKQDSE